MAKRRRAARGIAGFSMVELAITVAVIGIIAILAIPNLLKMQNRARKSEARINMKTAWTLQRAYYQEREKYESDVSRLRFAPERGNRFAYYFAPTILGCLLRSGSIELPLAATCIQVDTFKFPLSLPNPPLGIALPGVAPPTAGRASMFTVAAVGNIDSDDSWDVWTVSSETRSCKGDSVPAGVACNDRDDLDE